MFHRTVAELEATLGAGELAEWVNLMSREPVGEDRMDALFMSTWAYSVIGPHAAKPGDIVAEMALPWKRETKPVKMVSPAEFRNLLVGWGMNREVAN